LKKSWVIVLIILIAALCPVIAVTVSKFRSPSDLMTPPAISGENKEIYAAFENSFEDPSDVDLVYPASGSYRSAFISYDIDNDGKNEVIVLYSLKSDETTVRCAVLDDINGSWKCVATFNGYGVSVDFVDFRDLNGDKTPEILISWDLSESKDVKTLTVHDAVYSSGKVRALKAISNLTYSYEDIVDMDGDGLPEIFTAYIDSSGETQKAYGSLYKMTSAGSIAAVGGRTALDSSVSSYAGIRSGKNSDGTSVLYLDAEKGEDQMVTDVIVYDKNSSVITDVSLDKQTLSDTSTQRSPQVKCINLPSAGICIPVSVTSAGDDETLIGSYYTYAKRAVLSVYKDGSLTPYDSALLNFEYGYMITTGTADPAQFNATIGKKTGNLNVYTNDGDGSLGTELYSVIRVSLDEWTNSPPDGYSIIEKRSGYIYACKVTDAGTLRGITANSLADSLIIF
jgi:hypothetical protein